MSREAQIASIAKAIGIAFEELKTARERRKLFVDPESGHYVNVGGENIYFFNKTTKEPVELVNGIRIAHINAVDEVIFRLQGKIEGLRWKLVQLGKVTS